MAVDAGKQALVDGLNEDLAHEYEAIISYLLYSRLVSGAVRPQLSGFLESEIQDELEHAKFLSHKVVALGGTPVTEPAEIRLTEDNREMLQFALQSEKDTIERYTQRIKQAEAAGELGLKIDLETIVSDETKHKEELERILFNWE